VPAGLGLGRQVARTGGHQEAHEADTGDARQDARQGADGILRRPDRGPHQCSVRRHRVEQRHSRNLVRVRRRDESNVDPTGGVAGKDVRSAIARRRQEGVEVAGDGVPVLRAGSGLAPAAAGAVVGAHAGGLGDLGHDPGEVGRALAEAALEDDRRAPRAAARDEQPVPADVEELSARHRRTTVGRLDDALGGAAHGEQY
jgi:hypothetical protein